MAGNCELYKVRSDAKVFGLGMSRRDWLRRAAATGVFAGISLGVSGCDGREAAGTRLRVSFNKGDDPGYFAQAGVADTPYRIENVVLAQASVATEALNAGAFDFGLGSNISAAFLPDDAPVRYGGFHPFEASVFKLYVTPDSGIETTAQLRGKRIGYMRGGPLHLWLLDILRTEGLALSDVTAIALSALDSVAAFIRGDLDAVLVGYVAPSYQAERAGGKILVRGDRYPNHARINGFSVAVHESVLKDKDKSAAVADFLRRLRATWDWIDANEAEWARSQAELYGVPAGYIPANRPRPRHTVLSGNTVGLANAEAVASAFLEAGVISRVPDLPRVFDPAVEALLPLGEPAPA